MAGKKRIVKDYRGASLAELLPQFVAAQTAKGVSEKTIQVITDDGNGESESTLLRQS